MDIDQNVYGLRDDAQDLIWDLIHRYQILPSLNWHLPLNRMIFASSSEVSFINLENVAEEDLGEVFDLLKGWPANRLKELNLRHPGITDEQFHDLGRLRRLITLDLFMCQLTDASMANLDDKTPHLEQLFIAACDITGEHFEDLPSTLKTIYLEELDLLDDAPQRIAHAAPDLEHLLIYADDFEHAQKIAFPIKQIRPSLKITIQSQYQKISR